MTRKWGEPSQSRPIERRTCFLTVGSDHPIPVEDGVPPTIVADRYVVAELLGRGGVGEVYRAHDALLDRPVALKLIPNGALPPSALARFQEEAKISARLQHPGVVPIYDMGCLDDGRPWFTMKVVVGHTFGEELAQVHHAWRMGDPYALPRFRRLIEAFHRVAQTVASAHDQGVVHRDLKPSNLMLGAHGEVLVLDWGLAKLAASRPDVSGSGSATGALQTRQGAIMGTPAYMAPEQARGAAMEASPATDVYALGATLYDLLCERPPRLERDVHVLIKRVAVGDPVRPPSEMGDGIPVDPVLDRICLRALETQPEDRFDDAGQLAHELGLWLDGVRRREQAERLILEANEAFSVAKQARDLLVTHASEIATMTTALPKFATIDQKAELWHLEDLAAATVSRATRADARAVYKLRSALSHAPEWSQIREQLADHMHAKHRRLEENHRFDQCEAALTDLSDCDDTRYTAYIRGTGALTLVTEPPGAQASLYRFELVNRRLQPVPVRDLGQTPLIGVQLEMGSYLVELRCPGRETVRYPVFIERQNHWDGVPPGSTATAPVYLPKAGTLGAEDCYVPAGWAWLGDDAAHARPLSRTWVEGFVIRRHPVTVGEYVAFLNTIRERDGDAAADVLQPTMADGGEPFYDRDAAGRFRGIRQDRTEGDWGRIERGPRAPAVYTDAFMGDAFANFLAQSTGRPWRQPDEFEWQKAARSVDRRLYPWGDHFDPNWCRMRYSAPHIHFVGVDAYPTDVSPYGVRGMAGNVTQWVQSGEDWLRCGGACGNGPLSCMTHYRVPTPPNNRWGETTARPVYAIADVD